MGKWYDDSIKKSLGGREVLWDCFNNIMKKFKKDGFTKEEARLVIIGNAGINKNRIFMLPLELYWLDKYWDEEEK